jgi:O-antigen/teichoic acid export membrane protein
MIPDFYRHYTRRSLSVALPLIIFTLMAAPVLLVAWLGDFPDDAVAIVIILTVANCVNLSTGVATTLTLGDGRAGVLASVSMLVVVVNVILTVALAPFFGLWGVLGGTAIAIVVGAVVFLVNFHRHYGVPSGIYVRAAGAPVLVALLAGLPIVVWLLITGDPVSGRWAGFAVTFAFLATYVAIYWPIASSLDMLPERLSLRRIPRVTSVKA